MKGDLAPGLVTALSWGERDAPENSVTIAARIRYEPLYLNGRH
jgi:hypothetical protein